MSDPTGELYGPMQTRIAVVLWYNILYTKSYWEPYIHHFFMPKHAWQQNSRSLWLYFISNDGFTSTDASFYKNTVLRHNLYERLQFVVALSTYTLLCVSNMSGGYKFRRTRISLMAKVPLKKKVYAGLLKKRSEKKFAMHFYIPTSPMYNSTTLHIFTYRWCNHSFQMFVFFFQ